MNKTKIIIGSGILIGAAGIAYFLVKRSKATGTASSSSGAMQPSPITSSAPTAPRVSKYPEGTILQATGTAEVFLIDEKGYRHWITNRAAFDRMGFTPAMLKWISVDEMESIPRLQNISGLGILL